MYIKKINLLKRDGFVKNLLKYIISVSVLLSIRFCMAEDGLGTQSTLWEVYRTNSWSMVLPVGLVVSTRPFETSFLFVDKKGTPSSCLLARLEDINKFSFLVQSLNKTQSKLDHKNESERLFLISKTVLEKNHYQIYTNSDIFEVQLSDNTKGSCFWMLFKDDKECGMQVRIVVKDGMGDTWIISAFLQLPLKHSFLLEPQSIVLNTILEHMLSFSFTQSANQVKRIQMAYKILEAQPSQ